MSPTGIGTLVLACTFGGFLGGTLLRRRLPQHHLDGDSRSTVTVAVGLVATMTALVLGLVTASAKSAFDALDGAVKSAATDVLVLDRTLARYGSETREIRELLHRLVRQRIETTWPEDRSRAAHLDARELMREAEHLMHEIRVLSPRTDEQRWLKARAADLGEVLLGARWTVARGVGSSIQGPFITMIVFWLTIIFLSFGLFAPRHATVVATLFVCALSVAGAIFLILEMDGPFDGLITISGDPLRYAYSRINQ